MKLSVLNLVTPIRFKGPASSQIVATRELELHFLPDDEVVEFRELPHPSASKHELVLIVPRDNVASMVPASATQMKVSIPGH